MRALVLSVVLLVLAIASALLVDRMPADPRILSPYERGVYELVNREREAQKLRPLALDSKLMRAARAKAEDMKERDYFSHTSPEGERIGEIVNRFGYDYEYIGENMAKDWAAPEYAVLAWLSSTSHAAAILNPFCADTGMGQAGSYVVQLFGRRARD